MTQLSIFHTKSPLELMIEEMETGDPDGFRYFQRECYGANIDGFRSNRSLLNVLATGLGKTQIFSGIAKHWDGPVLILAERDELVEQAKRRIEIMTGEYAEVEKAEMVSSHRARLVVGSVQSFKQKRLDRLGKNRFSLVIIDEAHHSVAPTYRRIMDWFDAKYSGWTATPDRADEKALGAQWDEVAYVMDIEDGIDAGYLVPFHPSRCSEVILDELDLDAMAISKGDFQAKDLDAEMARHVEAVVRKTLELEPDRQGICFFPGVRSAELAMQRFNGVSPGLAEFVSGETDPFARKRIMDDFRRGRIRYLCNCQVACLDSETEILTTDGWVGHEHIRNSDRIANWNPDGSIFFAHPIAIEVRPRRAEERMIVLETPRMSIRVTDAHRVPFRRPGAVAFSEWRAADVVGQRGEFPVSGHAEPLDVTPLDAPIPPVARRLSANSYLLRRRGLSSAEAKKEASRRIGERDSLRRKAPSELTLPECRLIGYWLGDGGANRPPRGGVEYTFHNDKKLDRVNDWLESVFDAVGVDRIKRSRGTTWQWSVGRGTGFGPQRRRGLYAIEPYLVKDGSGLLWGLNDAQFASFLHGFWMADGNHGNAREPRSGAYEIHNTNRRLLDLLQAIAVCRGWRASLTWRSNNRGLGEFAPKKLGALYLSRRSSHTMTTHRFSNELGWKPETVWCVKSHSSWIIARRHGKVFVTGNTEGFDAPTTSLIVQARPTKSRALYAQMTGRGTRVLENVVDHIHGKGMAAERRAAVAASAKPDLVVLDFVGNCNKHELAGLVDILGGNYTPAEVKTAKKLVKEGREGASEALQRARRELKHMAEAMTEAKAKLEVTVRPFDPFQVLGLKMEDEDRYAHRFGGVPATPGQQGTLAKFGIPQQEIEQLSKRAASKLIDKCIGRMKHGWCSYRMLRQLQRFGITQMNIRQERAEAAMNYLKSKGWGKEPVDPEVLREIINHKRVAGED